MLDVLALHFTLNWPERSIGPAAANSVFDLAELEQNFGNRAATQSDGDTDGGVDGRDFLSWQRQFGAVAATSQFVQIPESPAVFLTLAALVILLRYRQRREATLR